MHANARNSWQDACAIPVPYSKGSRGPPLDRTSASAAAWQSGRVGELDAGGISSRRDDAHQAAQLIIIHALPRSLFEHRKLHARPLQYQSCRNPSATPSSVRLPPAASTEHPVVAAASD